jgi:hypothetical protein
LPELPVPVLLGLPPPPPVIAPLFSVLREQRESLDVFDRGGYLSPIQRDSFEHVVKSGTLPFEPVSSFESQSSGRPIDQLSVGRRERMSHSEEDPFICSSG